MQNVFQTHQELRDQFQWNIPEYFNIGVAVSDQQQPDDVAIIYDKGPVTNYEEAAAGTHHIEILTFGALSLASNQFASRLSSLGITKGARIGILLPQRPETAISHVATYKMGCIAVPLFVLFGPDAIEYRAYEAGIEVIVTDKMGLEKIQLIKGNLPALKYVILVSEEDDISDGDQVETRISEINATWLLDWQDFLKAGDQNFKTVATKADDPALIIFTSGTTGNPKGALHAHRVLLGHLPCIETAYDFFPQTNDIMWTPADWAWIGGLLDVLLPALYHGVPVVAYRAQKFDPEDTFALLARHKIRNVFFPPTALKLMRNVENPQVRHDYDLRSIISGGESMGEELLQWGKKIFGVTIAEIYGQTECNLTVSGCASALPVKLGYIGRPVPGHHVEIIDEEGKILAPLQEGQIAVKAPDPVMFLRYWNNEKATKEKFLGEFLLTGDAGFKDEDGYIKFLGRDDDVITTSGYRVGPGEIEDCLLKHPDVKMAGVVGVPDPIRTERIKAFIILHETQEKLSTTAQQELTDQLIAFVKKRLAAHEAPREIAFVSELPMTTTGKIMRGALRKQHIDSQS